MRLLGPALLLACTAAGCVGEASVTYQGTVTEAAADGYSFDDAPNPDGDPPIAGATVELCIDGCPGRAATTGQDGSYPEIEQIFGGLLGSKTHITVRATAPDGRAVSYETIFEDTHDPTYANPYCGEPPCPAHYLNLRIGPQP